MLSLEMQVQKSKKKYSEVFRLTAVRLWDCVSIWLIAEVCSNVNVEDGLTNGASCIIMGVAGKLVPVKAISYIWVKFENINIGKDTRKNHKHIYTKDVRPDWTPIFQVKKQFPVGRYKSCQILRSQFPLRPSSAKTVHRCQGDTMTSAVIDLRGRVFTHAHYVSLSRVKSLDNVHITYLNEDKISVSKEVDRSEEIRRLQTNYTFSPILG